MAENKHIKPEKGVACITGCAYAVQISKACFFKVKIHTPHSSAVELCSEQQLKHKTVFSK